MTDQLYILILSSAMSLSIDDCGMLHTIMPSFAYWTNSYGHHCLSILTELSLVFHKAWTILLGTEQTPNTFIVYDNQFIHNKLYHTL